MLWPSVSDTIPKGPLPFLVQQRSLLSQTQKSQGSHCSLVEELGQQSYSLLLQLTFWGFMLSPRHKWVESCQIFSCRSLMASQTCAMNMEHLSPRCFQERGSQKSRALSERAVCC